jgi:hypothetical protein
VLAGMIGKEVLRVTDDAGNGTLGLPFRT